MSFPETTSTSNKYHSNQSSNIGAYSIQTDNKIFPLYNCLKNAAFRLFLLAVVIKPTRGSRNAYLSVTT